MEISIGFLSYVLLFFAMSFLGWLIEVVCKYIEFRRFINRGFLIGPYCPIYGVGSVLTVLLLERYASAPLTVFLLTMVVCGTLEYMTSYIMEKLFHARWWDYSHRRFNIDGRVCASTLIPFGILGMVLIYLIKPALFRLFQSIPAPVLLAVTLLLCAVFAADAAISTNILRKIRSTADLTGADDTEKLTKAVRERLSRQNMLFRRTLRAFPYVRIYNSRMLEQIRRRHDNAAKQANLRRKQLYTDSIRLDQKLRSEIKKKGGRK